VRRAAAAAVGLLLAGTGFAPASSVLMISIDGMKPEYVLQGDSRALKIPYLRSLLKDGSYAEGVEGVWPTVTYPSHTTLVTGVAPSTHHILANLEFDPLHDRQEPWYWYAGEIASPTLWQAVHAAHRLTASVGWPVTVGATIDYLIPEFWRVAGLTQDPDPSDRYLIAALARPVGLLEELQDSAGPYMMANDDSLAGDAIKTRYSLEILRRFHPAFMTVHLSSLDAAEHSHGPFSGEANADLEALDAQIAQLAHAALAADPGTVVVVVSDHGFMPVRQQVNLAIPFVAAGLIGLSGDSARGAPKISSWQAEPWPAGGMAAIMLHDPRDPALLARVGQLLGTLAADPGSGIARILTEEQMRTMGGFPDASFVVEFAPGFYAGAGLAGALITPMPAGHGGHGYSPQRAEMRAAFFAAGAGVASARDLGVIDMRQIAPTVAALLGVSLPSATGAALDLAATPHRH
jgi:Type I phosphodiesterase / nucleotide pyrophosphatase